MSWVYLILAGCFEIGFTTFMKLSKGMTKWPYMVCFAVFAILSFFLLNRALLGIPMGTAYAVWTGIGAFGTAVVGMVFFNEPTEWARIVLLTTLIGSVVGLKFVS